MDNRSDPGAQDRKQASDEGGHGDGQRARTFNELLQRLTNGKHEFPEYEAAIAKRVEEAIANRYRLALGDAKTGRPLTDDERRRYLMLLFFEIATAMGLERFKETPLERLDQFAVMSVVKNHDTGGLIRSLVNSFMIAYSTPETSAPAYLVLTVLEGLRREIEAAHTGTNGVNGFNGVTLSRQDILTASGHYFNLLTPDDNIIEIDDIAHALSNCCLFAGHTREFYSVAQHSVLVSQILPPEHQLAGLLHDATKAYIGDVTYPLKQQLPDYISLEYWIEGSIFYRFCIPHPMPDCVKVADLRLLATEQRDLMPNPGRNWEVLSGIEPLSNHITPLPPAQAKQLFLDRFEELTR